MLAILPLEQRWLVAFVFLPGLLILCCPCDERDAYKVNGQLYDAAGNYIGSAQNTHFVPRHTPMHR
jgi:hypothetical protein